MGKPIEIVKRNLIGVMSMALYYLELAGGLPELCPSPIYVQIGSGLTIAVVTLISALAGTWVYSYLKPKLPH